MSTSRYREHLFSGLEPDLTSCLRGHLYPTSTHEMPSFYTFSKIRGLRKLVITIFYLILLTSPVLAFPRNKSSKPKIELMEEPDRIIVQTSNCKPLTSEQLRARLGPYFDEAKMRIDDEDDVTSDDSYKRSSSRHSVIDNGEADEDEEFLDRISESTTDDISDNEENIDTIGVQNIYMRRKRDLDDKSSYSDSSFLYQSMLFETISKRKSRQKRSASRIAPPWSCEKKSVWKKVMKGYFPSRILDLECTQKSCFYHQYRCNPVKYSLRVLKRDPKEACNPVPLIGNMTTYEESWVFKRVKVTVACECGLANSKSRKRTRGRKRN